MGKSRKLDFALAWPEHKERPFISWIKENCLARGMSFMWIHDKIIDNVIKLIEQGKLNIKFLFDMNATYSVPYDKYSRLCYAVKDAGGKVLDDPDDAKSATDKSITHYDLLDADINVPFTVVVRKWTPYTFKLTPEEKKKLGTPFVIKPATGYGKIGVIPDARTFREVANARNYNKGDDFLLQEKIEPLVFGDRRAYFRLFYVIGEIIPCWWDTRWGAQPWEKRIEEYKQVDLTELTNFKLTPLLQLVAKIAKITNMEFFSTEIAICRKGKHNNVPVIIDYVNDQCDLDVKTEEKTAPPDDVVEHIIKRIVKYAWSLNKELWTEKGYSIWLADCQF